MNMKAFIKKILILDKNRYENKKLKGYKRLENKIDFVEKDSIILNYVETIPREIQKLDFRYYLINFNTQYFDTMYLYCFIIMLVTFPFAMLFHPFLIFIIPIIYCLVSMICNFILTVIEIRQLRRNLKNIYDNIKKKL